MFVIMRMRMMVRRRMLVVVFMQRGMVVRRVGFAAVMIMERVGFAAVEEHSGLARADAAAIYRIEDQGCAEIEGRGGLLEQRGRYAGVDKGAEQHVATEAGE